MKKFTITIKVEDGALETFVQESKSGTIRLSDIVAALEMSKIEMIEAAKDFKTKNK